MTSKDDRSILGVESAPTLTDATTCQKWKLATENYLLVNGCLGIIERIDVEPYRRLTTNINGVTTSIAGSMPASMAPTGAETWNENDPGADESDTWEEWRKRELLTQRKL